MHSLVKHLHDYQVSNYWVDDINLTFTIKETYVEVVAISTYRKNPATPNYQLTLNGSAKLVQLLLNNQELDDYQLENDELQLTDLTESFSLTITTHLDPFNDKSCMGLYASNANLFTQCEAEGFRKITYYLDRPDVMSVFTTRIIANNKDYPVLLSNGNKIQERQLANGLTEVIWHDPFKKPSYLFALVAGKFDYLQDSFITKSKRKILLEVYSEPSSIKQCAHCLASLKKAMTWDETRFNLEYDLDHYMIVASGDFNMGAMENKGLNIFNTKYVLATSKTATDTDFINVEAVVGHEYFHNWTGNRVTCRDWFQLSLKEGLTVFRDQEFTAALHSSSLKRIQDVKMLRQLQFPEDASALAHPIRPSSYLEINNFYTMTVYEKGAEVVRMYQTLLGKDGFKRGLALYLAQNDSTAATCEDFCQAMSEANGFNLNQFMLWYSTAGTPELIITDNYDALTQIYTLNIQQKLRLATDKALLIPLIIALFSANGDKLTANLIEGEVIYPDNNTLLLVNKFDNQYKFKVATAPTPSLLRQFSAPVIINYPYSSKQLINLARYDDDSFNRWESLQQLYKIIIQNIYKNQLSTQHYQTIEDLLHTLESFLNNSKLDPDLQNIALTLPSFTEMASQIKNIDVLLLDNAIKQLYTILANRLQETWLKIYQQNLTSTYDFNDVGKRALKNTALSYLLHGDNANQYLDLVQQQYTSSDNMTDTFGALSAINDSQSALREQLLGKFLVEYQEYPLIMDKWFALQSSAQLDSTLTQVINLLNHPQFDKTNPNKLYALVRNFTSNQRYFHTPEGYQFISQEILRIDKFNPSVASRIANGFNIINCLNIKQQQLAAPYLQQILNNTTLSKDLYEIISKITMVVGFVKTTFSKT